MKEETPNCQTFVYIMSELFTIKQEPELDIVSDDEGDPLTGISTDNEGSALDNDANTLKVSNSYCFCSNETIIKLFLFPTVN